MEINKSIFREYDIRGVAGIEFDPKVVAEYEKWYGKFPGVTINLETTEALGKAYGTHIKRQGGKKVLIGFEKRPYGEELKQALIKGINACGIDVDDAGEVTTPLVYFITTNKQYDGGINITGSHNVYFFNGFKLSKAQTAPIYGQELQVLYQMVIDEDFEISDEPGKTQEITGMYEVYKQHLIKSIPVNKKINVAIDCGNGTPGLYAVDFLEALGCNVVKGLYLEPDAHFPNHVPDPESPSNMVDLQAAVKESGADIGIAWDADGDRVGFIDEKGTYYYSDEITALLARDALSRHPGGTILSDVKCSAFVQELVEQWGGVHLMHRTGHGPIKDTMRKNTDIVFAGEQSGHFYFVEDYVKADDGFFAAAKVLQILAEFDGTFSELMSFIPKRVRTFEIKLPCADEVKFDVVKKVQEEFGKNYETILIDGARVLFSDKAWGLVRASNTSPYLTIRVEGESKEEVLKIKNILADVLETFPEIGDKINRTEVSSNTGILGYV